MKEQWRNLRVLWYKTNRNRENKEREKINKERRKKTQNLPQLPWNAVEYVKFLVEARM